MSKHKGSKAAVAVAKRDDGFDASALPNGWHRDGERARYVLGGVVWADLPDLDAAVRAFKKAAAQFLNPPPYGVDDADARREKCLQVCASLDG